MIKAQSYALKIAACLCGVTVIAVTLFVFGYIFVKGWESMSWTFITDRPRGFPLGSEGGVFPAIMGTAYLGALSGLMAGIVGCAVAVYVVFFSKNKYINGIIRVSLYFLSGLPSILFGLVGYTILLNLLGIGRSLLTAGITVAVMILPFIAIRMIKIFKEDIVELFNASLSLGLSRTYILRKLILPKYFISLLTSVTLGMAYGVGAAAPVIYTGAVVFAQVPQSVHQPFMSLSYHLYMLINDGISIENAYGSAFLLMFMLLVVNIFCRALGYLQKRGSDRLGRKHRSDK